MNCIAIDGRIFKAPEMKQYQGGEYGVFTLLNEVGWGDKKKAFFFKIVGFGK